jgi:hypothetical protein
MLLIALAALAVLWAGAAAVVLGLCASAAQGDRVATGASYTLPRRSTWRTVRRSSLRSAHSDQLAT